MTCKWLNLISQFHSDFPVFTHPFFTHSNNIRNKKFIFRSIIHQIGLTLEYSFFFSSTSRLVVADAIDYTAINHLIEFRRQKLPEKTKKKKLFDD